jgi:O-antigen/teichoic acid export membrane protein
MLVSQFSLLRQLGWQGFATISNIFGGIAYTFILAKYLSPFSFGCFVLLMNSINLAFQLLDLRLVEIAIRLISSEIEKKETLKVFPVVKAVFCLGFLSALVAGVLSIVIGYFTLRQKIDGHNFYIGWILGWLAVAVNSTIGATAQSFLRAIYDFKTIAENVVLSQFLRITLVFFAIYFKFDSLGWMLGLSLFAAVASNLFLVFSTIRELKCRSFYDHFFLLPTGEIRDLIKKGGANYINSLLGVTTKELDVTLVGLFTGVRDVGEYKLAKTIVAGLFSIYDPFQNVAYSHIVKYIVQRSWGDLRRFVLKTSLGMLLVSVVVISLVSICGPALKQMLADKGYLNCWLYIKIMLIPMPIVGVLLCGNLVVLAMDRSGRLIKVNAPLQIFVVLIYVAFTWKYQANGTALAYAFALTIAAVAPLFVLTDPILWKGANPVSHIK